jgi:hypothetical protein
MSQSQPLNDPLRFKTSINENAVASVERLV